MSTYYDIKAIHENNLAKVLEELGVLEALREGTIVCKFCGKKLTQENIQCMYPKNGEIAFCCDDLKCFQKALEDSGSEREDV
jgi:hypothetical protein